MGTAVFIHYFPGCHQSFGRELDSLTPIAWLRALSPTVNKKGATKMFMPISHLREPTRNPDNLLPRLCKCETILEGIEDNFKVLLHL